MKKLILSVTVLSALTPAFAWAQGCNHGRVNQSAQISCADGQAWDAKSKSCIVVTG